MTDQDKLEGGSSAGRAYREQLAKEGVVLAPLPTAAPSAAVATPGAASGAAPAAAAPTAPAPGEPATANTREARAAERKKVTGRVRLVLPGGVVAGKLVDMSLSGVGILMEDVFPNKVVCTLECNVFRDGKHQNFSAPAVSVYGVLVRGKGFSVGFQFGPRSPAATQTIEAILAGCI
jgi:hypothetical protein